VCHRAISASWTTWRAVALRQISGVWVTDDAFLGGMLAQKPGRSENKALSITAVALDERGLPHHVRFDRLPDLKRASVQDRAQKALAPAHAWSPTAFRA
jgi:hypothetical protein